MCCILTVKSVRAGSKVQRENATHCNPSIHSAVLFNNDFMFPKGDLLHHYVVHSSIFICYFKATLYFQAYLSIHRPEELGHRPSVHKSNQISLGPPCQGFILIETLAYLPLTNKIWTKKYANMLALYAS